MKILLGLVAATLSMCAASVASARSIGAGTYVCTVEQRASIGSIHLEGAGPPQTDASAEHYRFRIQVEALRAGRLRIVELPYEGPERSQFQWEDDNSTLHSAYLGDGRAFTAEKGHGFLDFDDDRGADDLQFHHAGYEYAGGEDEKLSVRWGRCRVE